MSIFTKQILRQTTGGPDSSSQAFLSNQYVIPKYPHVDPFVFEVPMYGVTGGTLQYYAQDPNSIFTSLSVPFIRYQFTGNTFSLSGDTLIIHEVYKIRYSTFKEYNLNFERGLEDKSIDNTQHTETETITDETGKAVTRTIVRNISTNSTTTNFSKTGSDATDELVFELTKPITTFSGATSGITSSFYDFSPTQIVKATGSTDQLLPSEKLFDDKGQYFIRTYFRFSKNTIDGYFDEEEFGVDSQNNPIIITASTPSPEHLFTGVIPHVITATTFSGYSVAGSFFSYFDVPSKPKFEEPYVNGQLDTFSPSFFFSNVLDGDEYTLDINYDIADTGFTGTVYTSKIEKNLSTDNIQTYSTSLRNSSNFSYRIGNVKTLKNMFGVDQKVITYSETWTARTQSEPVSVYVFSSSDSPYITDLPVLSSPPNINISPDSSYSLSGIVSGSIVTGATIALTYPNGNTIVQNTTSGGTYNFTGLTAGDYIIETGYRGYKTSSRNITLSGTSSLSYKMELLWSNNYDTFGKMADENFFI